ncbi:MAG: hypothetical protein HUK19_07870 [Fibrobacter sp.]|nr:hypothetical protein [Fibrobacter sp.]
MRLGLAIILWFCAAAFCQEGAADTLSQGALQQGALLQDTLLKQSRDTVFIKVVHRDTVYLQLPKITDTVYVNEYASMVKEQNAPAMDSSMAFTSDDSSIHKSLFNIQTDIIGLIATASGMPAVDVSVEIPFNLKHSVLLGLTYAKKYPDSSSFKDTFNSIYSGDISQMTFGMGYRYCFLPTAATRFIELGSYFILRKSNYDNSWDNTNLINDRPHSEHKTHKGAQAFARYGLYRRGNHMGLALMGGVAYNYVPSFNGEILKGHGFYITRGIQFDIKINVSVGIL